MASQESQPPPKDKRLSRKGRYLAALPPLPIGAVEDPVLRTELAKAELLLEVNLPWIAARLEEVNALVEYDAALHQANGMILSALDALMGGTKETQHALLDYAKQYLPAAACVPICRRLIKAPDPGLQRKARSLARDKQPTEIALPDGPEGDWNFNGWMYGTETGRLAKHKTSKRVQESNAVPALGNVEELRALLGIQSVEQLGFLLLSSELANGEGPYVRFSIPKRNGEERPIAAPHFPLKRVQREILDKILGHLPTHDAAHGFVKGRSIVTNATQHQGRRLLIKFDLHDFFPTIHYFRVVGLFASLGYYMGEGKFERHNESESIAPVLARLCCYAAPGSSWGQAALPQGAPTSPAIANLICRGLDSRLKGLAARMNGTFTRYADDLTFSFDETPETGIGRFRWWVDQICQQEGFVLNQHKFRVIRNSQRQMVTGIVVNESDCLHIPRKERRRFRAILHNCRKHGLASQAKGRPYFASYIQGFASYIHMVHPEEGKALMAEVEAILTTARNDQDNPQADAV